jgi:Beta-lactamase enzyme family
VVKAMLLVAYLDRLAHERPITASDRALLGPMIRVSDNKAATAIYARLGAAALDRLARRAGMKRFSVGGYWGSARITAADQARFFARLDRLTPPRYRRYARRCSPRSSPGRPGGSRRSPALPGASSSRGAGGEARTGTSSTKWPCSSAAGVRWRSPSSPTATPATATGARRCAASGRGYSAREGEGPRERSGLPRSGPAAYPSSRSSRNTLSPFSSVSTATIGSPSASNANPTSLRSLDASISSASFQALSIRASCSPNARR